MATLIKGDIVVSSGRQATLVAADGYTAWLRSEAGENFFVLVSTVKVLPKRGDNPGGAAGPIPQEDVDRVKGGGPL